MPDKNRSVWLQFALFCSVLTLLIHLALVLLTDLNPIATPIRELSRHRLGALHTLGLSLFGGAHIALALALHGMDAGRLWSAARLLLVTAGVGLIYVALDFAAAPSCTRALPCGDAGLWIVASLTGIAMGAMQPGLSRQSRRLGVFSAICLGLWLWMVPVFLFVDELWVGAYQRAVGGIYVGWLSAVAVGLLACKRDSHPPSARRS